MGLEGCVSFYLMTSLKIMGMGPVHLIRALFHFPLENPLVVSMAQLGTLVESQKYFPKVVESQKYFPAQKLS